MSPIRVSMLSLVAALIGAGLILTAEGARAHDAESYVFVPNRASGDVAVIDSRRDEVVARVQVGKVPHQVVVSSALDLMVASNTADDTITIVDLETFETAATLRLGVEPEHMALSPTGAVLAVGNIGGGTVSLVSLEERRETARIEGLFEPHNLTFSPDGALLYVANLGAAHVSVIDVAKSAVIDEIPVAEQTRVAAVDGAVSEHYQGVINVTATPDGRLGFAAHGESGALAVIDLASRKKVGEVEVGPLPWRAFAMAGGRHMVVPNNGDRTASVISTETYQVVATLPAASGMTGVNGDAEGKTAFVLSRDEDKAVILDLVGLTGAGEIALPGRPETGVTTPDGAKLYVALSEANRVAVIDVAARKVVKTIEGVGQEPWGATMPGAGGYCH